MDILAPSIHTAIDTEARLSVGFIQHGVAAIRDLDGSNDFVQLPMQLLSVGLKRFFKLTIALAEHEQLGAFPINMKQRFRHNLEALPPHLVSLARQCSAYETRSACAQDLMFLTCDDVLTELLRAASEYAEQGRYHYLETILGGRRPPNPDAAWKNVVLKTIEALPAWRTTAPAENLDVFYCDMAAHLTGIVQRCARGVSRMWTLGPLGDVGRRYSGVVQPFLSLRDEDLTVPTYPRA